MKSAVLLLVLTFPCYSLAQPVPEWTSPIITGFERAGWKVLREDPLETRYFISDSVSYRLMTGPYSTTVAVTIPYTGNEYPDDVEPADASGDGVYDLVLYRAYLPTRYSVRVVNILTGQDIIVLDNPNYWYDAIQLADIDQDGLNELVVKRYDVPYSGNTVYEVYQTNGIATSAGFRTTELPGKLSLQQNFPNPFNPVTHIYYELSKAGVATIEVFDINGRLVRTFTNQHQEPGSHKIVWDGKDSAGSTVSTGTYFYRLVVDGSSLAKKMILLK